MYLCICVFVHLCICVLLYAAAIPLRSDLSLVDWNRIPSIALTAAAPANQCSISICQLFLQKNIFQLNSQVKTFLQNNIFERKFWVHFQMPQIPHSVVHTITLVNHIISSEQF